MPYSQIATQRDTPKNPQRYVATKKLCIVDEFSNDGELETFNADVIRKISENTYWVKKAELLDSKDNVIIQLGNYIYRDGNKALNQVPASNGYIIELVSHHDTWKNLIIWLASESGEKDSDIISMEFNKNFPIIY